MLHQCNGWVCSLMHRNAFTYLQVAITSPADPKVGVSFIWVPQQLFSRHFSPALIIMLTAEGHEAMACLSSSQEHDGPQWYPTLWYPIPWDDRIHRLVGRQRPLHMEEAPDGQRRGM